MPFWSKKKAIEAPGGSRGPESVRQTDASSHTTASFDQRFGRRRQEIKEISKECLDPGVPINELDDETLRQHVVKLQRLLQLVDDHHKDLEQHLVHDPHLIEAFPTLPTMLDRYSEDAQMRVRLIAQGLEWRKTLGT